MEYTWGDVSCPLCKSDEHVAFWDNLEDIYLSNIGENLGRCVRYKACKQCDMVYQSPRIPEDAFRKFYKSSYRPHNPTEKQIKGKISDASKIYDWIHARGEMVGGKSLDVGSSEGFLPRTLQSMSDQPGTPKWDAYGVEPTKNYAEWARQKCGVQVETGEFTKKTWRDMQFDLITMQHVLEHTYNPVKFLKTAHHKLYSDGWLYVGVPNLDVPRTPINGNFCAAPHMSLFTPRTLAKTLGKAGFYVDRMDNYERGLRCLARPFKLGEKQEHYGRDDIERLKKRLSDVSEAEREHIKAQQRKADMERESKEGDRSEVLAVSS